MNDTVPRPAPARPCPGTPTCVTDVVVIGGGALGAAAAWWLARGGTGVVLLEEGTARDLRLAARGAAWSTHPGWAAEADLLTEAVEAWREVERHTGAALLTRRDALDHGTGPTAPKSGGAWVEPLEAARRWPGATFAGPVLLRSDAVLQVRADHAVAALTASAVALGAVVRYRSPVTSVDVLNDGRVEVRTRDGRIRARRAIVTGVPRPAPSPGIELHFHLGSGHPDLPVIAHHDPELGVIRAAPCAQGHLAVGAGSWPRGTLGDLRAHVQAWWPGVDANRPEPVGPDAMSTVPAEVTVVRSGPLVTATTTALGSVDIVARGRRLAEQSLRGDPVDARTGT